MPKITLEAARVNAGLTQKQLADMLEVSRSTINNWERGKVSMKAAYLYAICNITGFSTDDIILPEVSTESRK